VTRRNRHQHRFAGSTGTVIDFWVKALTLALALLPRSVGRPGGNDRCVPRYYHYLPLSIARHLISSFGSLTVDICSPGEAVGYQWYQHLLVSQSRARSRARNQVGEEAFLLYLGSSGLTTLLNNTVTFSRLLPFCLTEILNPQSSDHPGAFRSESSLLLP
jgi:hypothetical protein